MSGLIEYYSRRRRAQEQQRAAQQDDRTEVTQDEAELPHEHTFFAQPAEVEHWQNEQLARAPTGAEPPMSTESRVHEPPQPAPLPTAVRARRVKARPRRTEATPEATAQAWTNGHVNNVQPMSRRPQRAESDQAQPPRRTPDRDYDRPTMAFDTLAAADAEAAAHAPAPPVADQQPQHAPAPPVAHEQPQHAPAPPVAHEQPQHVPAPPVAGEQPPVAPPLDIEAEPPSSQPERVAADQHPAAEATAPPAPPDPVIPPANPPAAMIPPTRERGRRENRSDLRPDRPATAEREPRRSRPVVAQSADNSSPPPRSEPQQPAAVSPAASAPSSFRERGQVQRRVRYLRHLREAQIRDLGGFMLELHRFETWRGDLVGAKLTAAAETDRELRALEQALGGEQRLHEVREAGIGGTCRNCGTLYGSVDRFCASCGVQLDRMARDQSNRPPASSSRRSANPSQPAESSSSRRSGPSARGAAAQEPRSGPRARRTP